MNLSSDAGWWALLVIVAVPLVVVTFGELAERLRQRGSPFGHLVRVTRSWVLPLATAYVLSRAVLGSRADAPANRLLATALVLAGGAVLFLAVRLAVTGIKHRAALQRRDAPPQLLLALPRVLLVLVIVWLLFGVVWGVEVSQTLTALGVSSLIVSLALQQPLGSLASGLFLLGDQPFRTGDWIQIGDDEGRVIDVNWRTTRLRTRGGDLVVLPNSNLAGATIVNYSQPTSVHRISQRVQVAFSNPPARAIEMLLAAAHDTPWVLDQPAPDVLLRQVDDPLMEYEVRVWIADRRYAPRARSALAVRIWYASERMGVPLPSPAQDLYLWDGPATAAAKVVPADELRRRLLASPWLAVLEDSDLDLLSMAARSQLFAPDETIMRLDAADGVVSDDAIRVLHGGRAAIVATTAPDVPGGLPERHVLADLVAGDVVAPLRGDRPAHVDVRVVAVTPCEVVVVAAAAAEVVIGRTPALAESIERTARGRRRRLERHLERQLERRRGDAPDAHGTGGTP